MNLTLVIARLNFTTELIWKSVNGEYSPSYIIMLAVPVLMIDKLTHGKQCQEALAIKNPFQSLFYFY